MSYHPSLGGFLERDPIGYADGANLYQHEEGNPANRTDALGLKTWFGEQGCENDCEGVVSAIVGNMPALKEGGRLANARDKSGFDWLALVAKAWKESKFDPNAANASSSAVGLFQILAPTADDIQDRVWPHDIGGSMLEGKQRLRNVRTDPSLSAEAAYIYLLDRITSAGNNFEKGLDRFGTGPGYGKSVLAGVAAIRKTCGFPPGRPVSFDQMVECAKKHCQELKDAFEAAVR